MKLDDFKALLLKAKPKQRLCYYTGKNLAEARCYNLDLDKIADYAMALNDIGAAVLFQKREDDGRMHYYISLTGKLTSRANGQGSFQEAERLRTLR